MKPIASSLDSTELKKSPSKSLDRLKICVFNVWYINLTGLDRTALIKQSQDTNLDVCDIEFFKQYFDTHIWPDRLLRLERIMSKNNSGKPVCKKPRRKKLKRLKPSK